MSDPRRDRQAELTRWLDDLSDDELTALEDLRTMFAEHGGTTAAMVKHLSSLLRTLGDLCASNPRFGETVQRGLVRRGREIWTTTYLVAYLAGSHDSLEEALYDDELTVLQAAGARLSPRVRGFLACAAEALRDGDLRGASAAMLAAYRERRGEVETAQLSQIAVELR